MGQPGLMQLAQAMGVDAAESRSDPMLEAFLYEMPVSKLVLMGALTESELDAPASETNALMQSREISPVAQDPSEYMGYAGGIACEGDAPMTIERIDPPFQAAERPMLEAWLDFHRATLALKCEGLSPEQLRQRSVPPSSLSLLGLVRHMAEVERSWFRRVLAGQEAPPLYYSKDDPDGDFDHVDEADPDEAFATWQAECQEARRLTAATPSLDDVGHGRNEDEISLRWILTHMIEEYARHNGHADFLRERIDGAIGD